MTFRDKNEKKKKKNTTDPFRSQLKYEPAIIRLNHLILLERVLALHFTY